MPDPFKYYEDKSSSSRRWYVVVPADGADLPTVPKALRFKAAGNVAIVGDDQQSVVLNVAAGETLDVSPQRVLATGTDLAAGNIIALC